MSVEAIIALAFLVAMLAALVVAALVIKSRYEDAGLDGANRGSAVLLIMAIPIFFLIFLVIQDELSEIPSGTYPVADTVLEYSPGSIDPTDVTVDGKTASVDAIQVDTALKEPLVVVKEDRVTLILPSRDYFASQANR